MDYVIAFGLAHSTLQDVPHAKTQSPQMHETTDQVTSYNSQKAKPQRETIQERAQLSERNPSRLCSSGFHPRVETKDAKETPLMDHSKELLLYLNEADERH